MNGTMSSQEADRERAPWLRTCAIAEVTEAAVAARLYSIKNLCRPTFATASG
jgi:hypothetical protein